MDSLNAIGAKQRGDEPSRGRKGDQAIILAHVLMGEDKAIALEPRFAHVDDATGVK